MTKTVAIYQGTEHGFFRLGVITLRGPYSIRHASEQILARYPTLKDRSVYVASRSKIMGKWIDGERIPLDAFQ
jgi:hypothetical protein